jgi:hypothetical protein
VALIVLYAGDFLVARLHGNAGLGSVDVQIMWAIKQKDGRIDYELGDTETRPCLHSLFPHSGYTPCWYLARHKNQVINVGSNRMVPSGVRRESLAALHSPASLRLQSEQYVLFSDSLSH